MSRKYKSYKKDGVYFERRDWLLVSTSYKLALAGGGGGYEVMNSGRMKLFFNTTIR